MPHQTVPDELFGSPVDPLDLMRADTDGMVDQRELASTAVLMGATFEALGSCPHGVPGCLHGAKAEYADQRAHDTFWMTASEREAQR